MKPLFRFVRAKYADDFSGEGSRLVGGRWSPVGIPVLYVDESAPLGALEFLVHMVRLGSPPEGLRIVEFELDPAATVENVSVADLPDDWRASSAPPSLQAFGADWATRGKSLCLRVPSAVMPFGREANLLINPRHPDFSSLLKHVRTDPFDFDPRLGS